MLWINNQIDIYRPLHAKRVHMYHSPKYAINLTKFKINLTKANRTKFKRIDIIQSTLTRHNVI